MVFYNPATHLIFYNALKLHVMRQVNLDQVTALCILYRNAEKVGKRAMLYTRRRRGREKDPKPPPFWDVLAALHLATATTPKASLRPLMAINLLTMASSIVLNSRSPSPKATWMREKAGGSNKHKSAPNNHQPWVDLLGKTKGKYISFLEQEKRVSFCQKGKEKA
ncbi:hypothetical protein DSO57_1015296 [Entomophthora muscae]|uniref:Uncharacterized protein n=1 Tax=Entomophthora muscae TaxID=34485 RepID=A0ACC2SU53_9FUNG|nr:hypothetical protein DSO57_1015296 [Entomophthora muscae]